MQITVRLSVTELQAIQHALRVARMEFERDAKQLGETPLAETFRGYEKRTQAVLEKLQNLMEREGFCV